MAKSCKPWPKPGLPEAHRAETTHTNGSWGSASTREQLRTQATESKTFQKSIKEKAGAKSIKIARRVGWCVKQERVKRVFTFPALTFGTSHLIPMAWKEIWWMCGYTKCYPKELDSVVIAQVAFLNFI